MAINGVNNRASRNGGDDTASLLSPRFRTAVRELSEHYDIVNTTSTLHSLQWAKHETLIIETSRTAAPRQVNAVTVQHSSQHEAGADTLCPCGRERSRPGVCPACMTNTAHISSRSAGRAPRNTETGHESNNGGGAQPTGNSRLAAQHHKDSATHDSNGSDTPRQVNDVPVQYSSQYEAGADTLCRCGRERFTPGVPRM